MVYTKTEWIDQAGQVKYTETADGDYKIFTPNFDDVTEMGTPVDAIHMNNIENGIEYCDTHMVVRKSTSQATGSTTQPVYVKADGTVEVCNIDVANTRFDSQWVTSNHKLSDATGEGVYTISVANYLPNDSYSYEVKVAFLGYRKSGTTNSYVAILKEPYYVADFDGFYIRQAYATCSFDGEHGECGNMECTVTVDSNRRFYYSITPAIYQGVLKMIEYRRIGTNL